MYFEFSSDLLESISHFEEQREPTAAVVKLLQGGTENLQKQAAIVTNKRSSIRVGHVIADQAESSCRIPLSHFTRGEQTLAAVK